MGCLYRGSEYSGFFIKTCARWMGQCQFEQNLGSSGELKESLMAELVHKESVPSMCDQQVLLRRHWKLVKIAL